MLLQLLILVMLALDVAGVRTRVEPALPAPVREEPLRVPLKHSPVRQGFYFDYRPPVGDLFQPLQLRPTDFTSLDPGTFRSAFTKLPEPRLASLHVKLPELRAPSLPEVKLVDLPPLPTVLSSALVYRPGIERYDFRPPERELSKLDHLAGSGLIQKPSAFLLILSSFLRRH